MYSGVSWPSGASDGYLVLGNTVYTMVVVTTCLKAGIEMDAWTWFSHGSIWGSIILWFFFLCIYSSIWPTITAFASNMPGMAFIIFSSPVFWLLMVLVPVVTLLADVAFKATKTTVFTTETDRIRIAEIVKREVAPYIENGRRPLTESSRLLRNVRKRFQRNKQRQQQMSQTELDVSHGYAFSQEERGAVSQTEYIRRYDTTMRPSSSRIGMPPVSESTSISSEDKTSSSRAANRRVRV